jgi:hypothetical protein
MNDEMNTITDASRLRRYRIELPNIIDDFGLSVHAFRLYVHILRVAGARGGTCTQSTRTLVKKCKMSLGKVSEAKRELQEAGLIAIEKKIGGDKITIVDLWRYNMRLFSLKKEERAKYFFRAKRSLYEQSQLRQRSYYEHPDLHDDKAEGGSGESSRSYSEHQNGDDRSYSERKKEPDLRKNQKKNSSAAVAARRSRNWLYENLMLRVFGVSPKDKAKRDVFNGRVVRLQGQLLKAEFGEEKKRTPQQEAEYIRDLRQALRFWERHITAARERGEELNRCQSPVAIINLLDRWRRDEKVGYLATTSPKPEQIRFQFKEPRLDDYVGSPTL